MENASKALIIAGAVLISILLIGAGVLIMNMLNPVTEGLDDQSQSIAAQQFNFQFLNYEGPRVGASSVKALFNTVNANQDPDHKVVINKVVNGTKTAVTNFSSLGFSTTYYKVEPQYTGGYITSIDISAAS